jgi:AcrR family transcriptional regulator
LATQDKKRLIIEAASKVLLEKGIEKTKVSDIVKQANIAQGTFYLYFPSKLSVIPEIAKEIVEDMLAAIKEYITEGASFVQQIDEVVDAYMSFTKSHRDTLQLLYAGLAQSEHFTQWEEIYNPLYHWIADLLDEAKEKKELDGKISSLFTAKFLVGTIESGAEQLYLYQRNEDENAHQEHIKALREFVKRALGIQ